MRRFFFTTAGWTSLVVFCLSIPVIARSQEAGEKASSLPNFVFILADDLGYGDVQAFNPDSRIPTPNLDRLARQGMRFTDAHSGSGVCTPTRYGVMTGRYCWRTRLKRGVLFPPNDKPLIEPDRLTVARMLQQKGYHTACIGKWHLGFEWGRDDEGNVDFNRPIQYGPTDVGFDTFFGIAASLDMVPYAFYRNHHPTAEVSEEQPRLPFPKFVRQGPRARGFDPGKALDQLTQEAVAYIEERAEQQQPFFLYFALTSPHKPVWPAPRFREATPLGPYGDFVHQTDWTVGRVLEAIEANGVTDNTLVVFTSDNGSYMFRREEDKPDHTQSSDIQGFKPSNHEANDGWRGTKADIWEGGHRVPFVVRWPGRIQPGSSCEATICHTDFMATAAEIAGISLPAHAAEDSYSWLPLLTGDSTLARPAPVVHHSSRGMFALRQGRWKLVFGNGSGGRQKPVGKPFQRPYFLFDLENDPGETTNLIERHPEVAARLEQRLKEIRGE